MNDVDVAEVRRRLRGAIEAARKHGQERRARSDQAVKEYEEFLRDRATPVFQVFAQALAAEGYRFHVFTPADAVRLASEFATEDFIELALDPSVDPPGVAGRTSRGRGRRQVTSERPLREGAFIAQLTQDDVLAFLAEEIVPFVER